MQTIYIAQAFDFEVRKGKVTKNLQAESPFQFKTAEDAISKAQRLADKKAGAIAIAQQYNEGSDEMGEFEVLYSFGTLPQGLIED